MQREVDEHWEQGDSLDNGASPESGSTTALLSDEQLSSENVEPEVSAEAGAGDAEAPVTDPVVPVEKSLEAAITVEVPALQGSVELQTGQENALEESDESTDPGTADENGAKAQAGTEQPEEDDSQVGQVSESYAEPREGGIAQPVQVPSPPLPGIPDLGEVIEDDLDDEFLDIEELERLGSLEPADESGIQRGSRQTGRIISIDSTGVIVSFDAKVEGFIPLEEFREVDGTLAVEVDQEIEFLVIRPGGASGYAKLSYRRLKDAEIWKRLETAQTEQAPLEARILENIKGGFRVDIGVSGFLPISQLDVKPVAKPEEWLGTTVEVQVMECNRRRANVVVSRAALLIVALNKQKEETLSRLAVGEPVTGTVKNISAFGVFVDLGGIDGLIRLNDLSYFRYERIEDILQPGQEVVARVLELDLEKDRISLGLKQMGQDPWAGVNERFPEGSHVQGAVTDIKDYGAFVEIEPGVEGLIHISEMSWAHRLPNPAKVLTVGEKVEAVVLKVNREERRISLSLKQLKLEPWEEYGNSFAVGQVVEGTVGKLTSYGAFVEIQEGIHGLLHISDLTWGPPPKNPAEMLQKGLKLKAVVLSVDREKKKLSLGVKHLEPDTWITFILEHTTGDTVTGQVLRLVKHGAYVKLAPGIQGLCFNSGIPHKKSGKGQSGLKVQKTYNFEILCIHERERKIDLRCCNTTPLSMEQLGEERR